MHVLQLDTEWCNICDEVQLEDTQEERSKMVKHLDEKVPPKPDIGSEIGASQTFESDLSMKILPNSQLLGGTSLQDLVKGDERPAAEKPAGQQGDEGRNSEEKHCGKCKSLERGSFVVAMLSCEHSERG